MGADTPTQPIASALFGATLQGVLRLIFGFPHERFYQRQIVRHVGLGYGAVQRVLRRLERCGLLLRSVEGRQTYYQANTDSPVFEELRGLIRKTFGVADMVRGALAPLEKQIRVAFNHGSVAGGTDTVESDLDLFIIADSLRLVDVVAVLRHTQKDLGREVNPTVYQTKEFARKLSRGHPIVANVVVGPKLFVVGNQVELTRLGEIRLDQASSRDPRRGRRVVRTRRLRPRCLPDRGSGHGLAIQRCLQRGPANGDGSPSRCRIPGVPDRTSPASHSLSRIHTGPAGKRNRPF